MVLAEETQVVETKKKETDELLERVGQESIVAEEQAEIAAVEEEKVSKVQTEVGAFQEQCMKDLAAAEPAIIKAPYISPISPLYPPYISRHHQGDGRAQP